MLRWLASLPRHNYMADRPSLPAAAADTGAESEREDVVDTESAAMAVEDVLPKFSTPAADGDEDDLSSHGVFGKVVTTDEWPVSDTAGT